MMIFGFRAGTGGIYYDIIYIIHIIYLRDMAVTVATAAMFVQKLTKHPIRLRRHSPTRLLPTDRRRRKGRLPLEKQKQRPLGTYNNIIYI